MCCWLNMDLTGGYHPVFLFVLWLQAVAGYVEPPTNVTLHCHNLHNVLMWSHDKLSMPGLTFRIDIGSVSDSPSELWVNSSSPLQVDLSSLSDPSNDYMVSVTAVIGQNESNPVPSDGHTFSYFQDSLAKQKCFLDFPPVNVTAQHDGNVVLRFSHPWLLYHHKLPDGLNPKPRKEKTNKLLPVFNYNVVITSQKRHPHHFNCEEKVCEKKLPVDAAQEKHCLMVTGELQKMSLKAKQEYCTLEPSNSDENNYIYVYIIAGVLALAALVLVLIMLYHKQTKSPSSLPDSMTFGKRLKQFTMGVVQEQIYVPQVEPASPSPLLPEEKESIPAVTSPTEADIRLPIGVQTKDEGGSDDEEVGDDEGPGYMPGGCLDEDTGPYSSKPPSGYEKRQVFVEVGQDEQVEGYRG